MGQHDHGAGNTAARDGFYQSGRRAFAAGMALQDCPLAPGSRARDGWREGWIDAKDGTGAAKAEDR